MLIVGLGNPGENYIRTRHNAGFIALDYLVESLGTSFQYNKKFEAEIASTVYQGKKIYLLKPQTYMNLSGRSVSLVKNYYKIDLEDIIVLHDELDIPLGSLRIKKGGGSAGHNGIKSIDAGIGKDYYRVRLGIGRPDSNIDPADYVLSKFSKNEQMSLEELIADIVRNFDLLFLRDFDKFQLQFKN